MSTRKGSIIFIVFCMVLVVLCWQAPVQAASVPPTIDQIVGTYAVTDKEVYYYFDEGIPVKEKYLLTWRISQTSDSTVQVQVDQWFWTFTAYYKNGYFIQSLRDADGVGVGIATFSGKTGKIKFKGDFGWGQFGGLDEYCEWDPFSGKMISTNPDFVISIAGSSQVFEQAVSTPEEGEGLLGKTAALPLSIDALPGTYSCTMKGTLYHPTAGTKEKGKLSQNLTISKFDDYTLNINSPEWNVQAHYGTGILMVSDVDVNVLDPDASFAIILAKGKPGKISLKGKVLSVMELGTPDDEFEVGNVSCKRISD